MGFVMQTTLWCQLIFASSWFLIRCTLLIPERKFGMNKLVMLTCFLLASFDELFFDSSGILLAKPHLFTTSGHASHKKQLFVRGLLLPYHCCCTQMVWMKLNYLRIAFRSLGSAFLWVSLFVKSFYFGFKWHVTHLLEHIKWNKTALCSLNVTVVVVVVAVVSYCPLMKTTGMTALGFNFSQSLIAVPCTFGLVDQTVHMVHLNKCLEKSISTQ